MKRLSALVALTLISCSAPQLCIDGATQACVCTDGQSGAQTCQGGASFSPCTCTGGAGGGAGGGSGGSGGGFAGGKRIFLTSATYVADLGGLSGADTQCQSSASGAALSGTWKAWASSAATNAIDRISDVGPWFLLDGRKAFNNKANLSSTPLVPITVNERGMPVQEALPVAWTMTKSGGLSGANCDDWTNAYGIGSVGQTGSASTTGSWTAYVTRPCNEMYHLYCIEQ